MPPAASTHSPHPRERSRELGWEEIAAARPDVVVVMPCGLHADEAEAEARRHAGALGTLGARAAFAVDAAASFSRPGPRLADGVELLGHLLHPDLVPPPAGLAGPPAHHLAGRRGGNLPRCPTWPWADEGDVVEGRRLGELAASIQVARIS